MCKENLDLIEEEVEECEENREIRYYSEDEIVDIVEECVGQIIPKVVVDFEPVQGITVYDDGFIDGCSDASYWSGYYSTLVSAGISPDRAYELTLNQQTSIANMEQQKIVNEGNIQVAKYQALAGLQTQV